MSTTHHCSECGALCPDGNNLCHPSAIVETIIEAAPDLDRAYREVRRWYYSGVRSLVEGLIEECLAEKHKTGYAARKWLLERVDEDTDQHEFVIYTFKAKCALLASDNENAYQEEVGELAQSVEAAARWAMRRDVWELLEARSDEWIPGGAA